MKLCCQVTVEWGTARAGRCALEALWPTAPVSSSSHPGSFPSVFTPPPPVHCSHFKELTEAGLEPNTAAAYGLKWAVGAAAPVAIAAPPAATDDHPPPSSSGDATLSATEEAQLRAFLASGDAVFLTTLLHCRTPPSTQPAAPPSAPPSGTAVLSTQPESSPSEASAAEPAFLQSISLDRVAAFYARTFRGSDTVAAAPAVAQQLRQLLATDGPLAGTLTWSPAAAQAVILASLLLLPHTAEVRLPWQRSCLVHAKGRVRFPGNRTAQRCVLTRGMQVAVGRGGRDGQTSGARRRALALAVARQLYDEGF